MKLSQSFYKAAVHCDYWKPNDHLLIAVSGGVDSLVLLDLLVKLPKTLRPHLAVAHINHQLRSESAEEERYIQLLCERYGIRCHITCWSEGLTIKRNIEQAARSFRYAYFDQLMHEYHYQVLVTAHHADDQLETVLMRLIKGSRLSSMTGIKSISQRQSYKLVRPLLSYDKQQIQAYADLSNLAFFHDQSNDSAAYLRNRLRHQLIPLMKQENPRVTAQVGYFTKQLSHAQAVIDQCVAKKYPECFFSENDCFVIDLKRFLLHSPDLQFMLLEKWWDMIEQSQQIVVPLIVRENVFDHLQAKRSQWSIDLKQGWQVKRRYDRLLFAQSAKQIQLSETFYLSIDQGFFLSEREWIGLDGGDLSIPLRVAAWNSQAIDCMLDKSDRLSIRRPRSGDRFKLNKQGQTKKVSRYFIDQKIASEKRQQSWIVTDSAENILWIIPYRKSYLSIDQETDKIHYRLVYFNC